MTRARGSLEALSSSRQLGDKAERNESDEAAMEQLLALPGSRQHLLQIPDLLAQLADIGVES
jgi:hypothetical protein